MVAPIVIEKVKLRNFLSHKETELAFDRGVTVFVGPNGAGKTSILEAIYYALTGKGWRVKGNERKPLIRKGANSAAIEVWLNGPPGSIYVRRSITKKGRPETEVRIGKEIIRSDAEASKKLREIIGLDSEALKNVGILPQGGITTLFVSLKGSERKELIDRLFGLDAYETLWNLLGDYVLEITTKKFGTLTVSPTDTSISSLRKNIRKYAADILNKKEDYAALKTIVGELDKRIRVLALKSNELRKEITDIKKRLEGLKDIEKKAGGFQAQISSLKKRLDELRSKEAELTKSLDKLQKEMRDYERIKIKADSVNILQSIKELQTKVAELKKELERKKSELKKQEESLSKLRELRLKYPSGAGGIEEALRNIRARLQELSGARETSQARLTELRTTEKLLRERLQEIYKEVEEYASMLRLKLSSRAEDINELVNELRERLSELRKNEEKIKADLDRESASQARMLERMRELENNLAKLTDNSLGGRCPLCGQPLTKEHVEALKKRFLNELKDLKVRVSDAEEKTEDLRKKLRELEAQINDLIPYLSTSEDVLRKAMEAQDISRKLTEINESVNKEVSKLDSLSKEIEDLTSKEEKLVSALKEVSQIESLKEIVSEEAVEALKDEITGKALKIKTYEEELNKAISSISDIFDLSRGVEEAIKEAKDSVERLQEIQDLKVQKEAIERQLKDLRNEEIMVKKELEKIEAAHKVILGKLRLKEELQKKLDSLTTQLNEVEKQLSGVGREYEVRKTRLSSLKEEITDMQEDLRRVIDGWFKAEVLKWLRSNVVYRDKAPQELRKAYATEVEALVREYLNAFNLQYSDVRVDKEFNIFLKSPHHGGEEVEISGLSGGEQIVASLISLLALHKIVSGGRLGFLALDEPTVYLDDERRKLLIEVLKEFKGGEYINQLIIVTHDDDVKEAADSMYEIRNVQGSSEVKEVTLYE